MTDLSIKRNYSLTDGELATFVSNFIGILNRDLDDLSTFGLNEDKINDLKNKGDDFEMLPSDEYAAGMQAIATENKNNLLSILKDKTYQMAWRVEAKWGINSTQYKMLGVTGLHNQPEDTILRLSRNVSRCMEMFLSDLEEFGLTQDIIDDYNVNINDVEVAKNNQNDAMIQRDAATQERIVAGNELYKIVVSYCEIGKRLYAKTNPAKYNDYIIYTNVNPGPVNAPKNFKYAYDTWKFTWDAMDNATSYQLQSSSDNVNWIDAYDGPDNFYVLSDQAIEHTYWRVRARNAGGFSDFSFTVNITNPVVLPLTTSFTYQSQYPRFVWAYVNGATRYEVKVRLSSGTDDDYVRIYYGTEDNVLHADAPGEYYATIRCWNANGCSGLYLLAYNVVNP